MVGREVHIVEFREHVLHDPTECGNAVAVVERIAEMHVRVAQREQVGERFTIQPLECGDVPGQRIIHSDQHTGTRGICLPCPGGRTCGPNA